MPICTFSMFSNSFHPLNKIFSRKTFPENLILFEKKLMKRFELSTWFGTYALLTTDKNHLCHRSKTTIMIMTLKRGKKKSEKKIKRNEVSISQALDSCSAWCITNHSRRLSLCSNFLLSHISWLSHRFSHLRRKTCVKRSQKYLGNYLKSIMM